MSVMMDESDAGGGRMSAIDDELEYDMGYAEWVREHDKKLEAELWSGQMEKLMDQLNYHPEPFYPAKLEPYDKPWYSGEIDYKGPEVKWLSFDEYSNGSIADIIDNMIMKEIEEDNQRNTEKRAYLNWLRKCK